MGLRRSLTAVVAALALAVAGLAAPAGAWAEFPVNQLGDQPDETINGTCDIAGGGGNECTLRAAIEEANSASNVDLITFAGAGFNGEDADVITVTSDLPTISEPLNILGGHCETEASPPPPADPIMGPCGRVTRSGSGSLFVVDSDEVTIKGLSITGAVNGMANQKSRRSQKRTSTTTALPSAATRSRMSSPISSARSASNRSKTSRSSCAAMAAIRSSLISPPPLAVPAPHP